MPRLVRQAPLSERIKAYLDPYDFLLWLSETLNDDTYDEWLKDWATVIGVALNLLFILARGASKAGLSRGADDVFGDDSEGSGSGWFSWFAAFLVHLLTLLCCVNAFYTFLRKRHYRLFEQPVDIAPATPSAHRVRVDSSPMSSSPLRYLQNMIATSTAASRAYPDAHREVWELSLWDPKPVNLTVFTTFSPGHIVLYLALLPPTTLDRRPSVTVLTAILFGAILTVQLTLLKLSFSQQAKDSALIHGEVINEYDTKFVRPTINRPVRNVGTQTRTSSSQTPHQAREVDVYTPTTVVNRGFRTNPNPNYAAHYDPNNLSAEKEPRRLSTASSALSTPTHTYTNAYTNPASTTTPSYPRPPPSTTTTPAGADFSSPLKPHHQLQRPTQRGTHDRRTIGAVGAGTGGDGGSMGIYTHAASPLRKAASSSYLTTGTSAAKRTGEDGQRPGSPLKRTSAYGSGTGTGDGHSAAAARRRETGRF